MKIYKQSNFKKTTNEKSPKIWEIIWLYDWNQAHWCNIVDEQNWLFKGEFFTYWILWSNIQKWDLVFFSKEYVFKFLEDLHKPKEKKTKGSKKKAFFW